MPALHLTPEQKVLRKQLQAQVTRINKLLREGRFYDAIDALPSMAPIAHELHASLKQAGHEPRYTSPLLGARGYKPDDVRFYYNVHPAEYLLKFISHPDTPQGPPEFHVLAAGEVHRKHANG